MKKKIFLFCSLAVLTALAATSCQKEQRTVTLGLSLEQDAKLVIDNYNYPCWSKGDTVYVNTGAYGVSDISNGGRSAQVANVLASNEGYCVLYPASLVSSGTTISSGDVSVDLPPTQEYALENGRQKVELPMGGVNSSTDMMLHNLGSILRVKVTNGFTDNRSVTISQIKVTANNAYLSGSCTATINGSTADKIVANSFGGNHSMKLIIPSDAATATIAAGDDETFSIVLPTFSTGSQITVRVTTTEGGYQDFQTNTTDITLASNQIVNFNATLNNYTGSEAYLKGGSDIKKAIAAAIQANSNITAVSFVCGPTTATSGTELQSDGSPTKIYGNAVLNADGQHYTYVISTPASVMKATDCDYMFQYLSGLTSITFGTGFSTEEVIYMRSMFYGCSGLTSLDLSGFNTGKVQQMLGMFNGCSNLTSITFGTGFNTSRVRYMNSMFSGCSKLTSLNLSGFNTGKVEVMSNMFNGCSRLSTLNLSNFNTERVTTMSSMFSGCDSLRSLDLSSFNTERVTTMSSMFSGCDSLRSLNLSSFNTGMVNNMGLMFYGCSGLTSLNLYNFSMRSEGVNKFQMCSGLATSSSSCTITCTEAVQEALQERTVTYLPYEREVHFEWITPPSDDE